jgi:hypothetical protein
MVLTAAFPPLQYVSWASNVQMCGISGDLVAETLGGDDGNLVANSLVGLEVQGQLGVVPLNDDLGGLLDSLCSNATHVGDWWWLVRRSGGRAVVSSRGQGRKLEVERSKCAKSLSEGPVVFPFRPSL